MEQKRINMVKKRAASFEIEVEWTDRALALHPTALEISSARPLHFRDADGSRLPLEERCRLSDADLVGTLQGHARVGDTVRFEALPGASFVIRKREWQVSRGHPTGIRITVDLP